MVEVRELKIKIFLELMQNAIIMISKPLIVVIVLKLLVLRDGEFTI